MCNNSSYCCKNCPENPISYKILLKKKFWKKNFHQKKSKNQNWSIFDFSLIGRSVFELEAKNWKIEKAGRTWPEDCFYLPERGVRCCSLDCHWATEWFKVILLLLFKHFLLLGVTNIFNPSVKIFSHGFELKIFVTPRRRKCLKEGGWPWTTQLLSGSQESNISPPSQAGRNNPLTKFYLLSQFSSFCL